MNATKLPQVVTASRIANCLGVSLHRVSHILATRHHIQPSALAGRTRLYKPDAIAMVRHELNAIDARKASQV